MKIGFGTKTQWIVLVALSATAVLTIILAPQTKNDEFAYKGAVLNGMGLAIEQELGIDVIDQDHDTLVTLQPWAMQPCKNVRFNCSANHCTFSAFRQKDGVIIDKKTDEAIGNAIKAKHDLYVAVASAGYVIKQSKQPGQ